jgi:hypothetical protein
LRYPESSGFSLVVAWFYPTLPPVQGRSGEPSAVPICCGQIGPSSDGYGYHLQSSKPAPYRLRTPLALRMLVLYAS